MEKETTTEPKQEAKQEFTPPKTQEELNSIITMRLERERKKFADYEDLKAKAQKFDEIEEANKNELEKANETIVKLKAEAEAMSKAQELEKVRQKVSSDTGVPASLLVGDSEESMTEYATKIKEFARPEVAPKSEHAGKFAEGEAENAEMRKFVHDLLPN